jgi:hypothetical protein
MPLTRRTVLPDFAVRAVVTVLTRAVPAIAGTAPAVPRSPGRHGRKAVGTVAGAVGQAVAAVAPRRQLDVDRRGDPVGGADVLGTRRLHDDRRSPRTLGGMIDAPRRGCLLGRPVVDKPRLGELVDLIGPLGFGDKENQSKDILGRVYEYFLSELSVYGQESNPTTWRLAKMNLAIRGIEANLGPENAHTFHRDLQ